MGLNRAVGVVAAAAVLIGGANLAAYAANGKPLLLGKTNKETRTAVVKNTGSGPALKLTTKRSAPPLAVNSRQRVARLNADQVDGLHATDLQTHSQIFRIPPQAGVGSFVLDLGLEPGVYQVSYSVISLMSAADTAINCHFWAESGFYELLGYGSKYSSYSTANGSGILDTRSLDKTFRCFTSGGTATVDADFPEQSQIVVTPIDGLSVGTAVPVAPIAPKHRGLGR
ncbi:hypothetical protein [Nocardioides sp.]|uniref:hypothetical protein n=1 Tax=Nocardioides sp. TaxID=35761 RepID=UPI0035640623